MAKQINNVAMAVSSDVGDSLNVHPIDKKPVGERLAKLALKYTYKKDISASGPQAIKAVREKEYIVVSFSNAKKLATADQKKLIGFELLTTKGVRIKVDAFISQLNVYLKIPEGEEIKEVMYAWQPFTRANLISEASLPASTFSMNIK